jgi:hypothetical protein
MKITELPPEAQELILIRYRDFMQEFLVGIQVFFEVEDLHFVSALFHSGPDVEAALILGSEPPGIVSGPRYTSQCFRSIADSIDPDAPGAAIVRKSKVSPQDQSWYEGN